MVIRINDNTVGHFDNTYGDADNASGDAGGDEVMAGAGSSRLDICLATVNGARKNGRFLDF